MAEKKYRPWFWYGVLAVMTVIFFVGAVDCAKMALKLFT